MTATDPTPRVGRPRKAAAIEELRQQRAHATEMAGAVLTGEVVDGNSAHLDALAQRIRGERNRAGLLMLDLLEARMVIGRCLLEAREALPSDHAFGEWFTAQNFGFSGQWGRILRTAASHEDEVRDAVQSQLATGTETPNFEQVVRQVVAASAPPAPAPVTAKPSPRPPLTDQTGRAASEVGKAVERLERLAADDRFDRNRQRIADQWRGELTRAVGVCTDLLDGLEDDRADTVATPAVSPQTSYMQHLVSAHGDMVRDLVRRMPGAASAITAEEARGYLPEIKQAGESIASIIRTLEQIGGAE